MSCPTKNLLTVAEARAHRASLQKYLEAQQVSTEDPFGESRPNLSRQERNWLSHRVNNGLQVVFTNIRIQLAAIGRGERVNPEALREALRAAESIHATVSDVCGS